MASSEQQQEHQDVGLDFHRAFQAIDTDHSGEITIEELQNYCRKMNYRETFVQKWLTLFDEDQNGKITYDEYCNALGLGPKKDVAAKHKASAKKAPTGKAAKRRKQQQQQPPPQQQQQQQQQQKEEEEAAATAETAASVTSTETVKAATAGQTSAAVPAPAAPAAPTAANQKRPRQRNHPISAKSGGLMRYSRARMFQRKALYRLAKKSSGPPPPPTPPSTKKSPSAAAAASSTQKPIGGERNGGTRAVPNRRTPRSLPTSVKPRRLQHRPRRSFAQHKRRLRPGMRPGAVLVLLAGRHRGKRVVLLKQLASGLLLVTGPLRVNGCPLRRVCQSYAIATGTRLCLEGVRVPERVNDQYFRRSKRLAKKLSRGSESAAAAEDVFASQSPVYQLAQERKEDQKAVDSQVMAAICSREDKKMMLGYLRSLFCLKSGQKPHEMLF